MCLLAGPIFFLVCAKKRGGGVRTTLYTHPHPHYHLTHLHPPTSTYTHLHPPTPTYTHLHPPTPTYTHLHSPHPHPPQLTFLNAFSVYRRKHLPGRVLPALPARCCAEAFEIGETSSDSTRIRGL